MFTITVTYENSKLAVQTNTQDKLVLYEMLIGALGVIKEQAGQAQQIIQPVGLIVQ